MTSDSDIIFNEKGRVNHPAYHTCICSITVIHP
jgi:hypothetical protein